MEQFSTKLLGLKGVFVTSLKDFESTIHIHLESKPHTVTCPCCGGMVSRIHDYRTQRIKDLPYRNKYVILFLKKRRYRCACGKRFFEHYDFLPRYHHMTRRVYESIIHELRHLYSMKDVAGRFSVSTNTVTRVFNIVQYVPQKLPVVLSLDEFKGNSGGNKYHLIITDPVKHKTLDILPSREKTAVFQYFLRFRDRERVKFVVMDMWAPYYDVAKLLFPNATVIIDKYHYVRQVTWAFENVRKAQQKTFNTEQRLRFKRSKKLLNAKYDSLSLDNKLLVHSMVEHNEQIFNAWQLKELFVRFRCCKDSIAGAVELSRFIETCKEVNLPEFKAALTAFKNWKEPILNSLDYPYTNGFTEGTNNKIKVLKRNAFGFRNFNRFRNRILHVCAH